MKGDFTRFTFKPQKHYTSVLMQQGRVQLDADWNEQADIHAYFNQSIAQDMIGVSGAVKGEVREGVRDSFQISTTADADHHTDLIIAPGHFYVNGILCELDFGTPFTVEKTNNPSSVFAVKSLIVDGRPLEAEQWVEILDKNNQPIKKLQINTVDRSQNLLSFAENVSTNKLRRVITYKTQPDYPQALQTDIELELEKKLPKTYYLAYLDVWQRHITAIEDTNIREVALNGNDTTTRTQTVWQVKLYEIPGLTKEEVNRELAIQKWQQDPKINHSPVYLTAKIKEGNQNWDNQLYRIEIHQPGKLGIASFKWSKNNGSTVFPIKEIVGNQISLNNPSRDASQSFTPNQWIEITDDALVLQGKPGTLVQLKGAVRDKLTFDPTTVEGKPIDSNYFPQKYHPKVTAWDGMTKNATVSIDGIEVNFSAESEQDRDIVYRTGDYWLIPTRKVKVNGSNIIGDFGSSLPQTPAGIEHHYSPLALLSYDGKNFNIEEDLRSTFAPLSRALDKAGGIITGKLEIQDNLYITGKNIPTQDNTGTKFIPGKVRIGTEISQNGKHLLAEPDARLHLQGTPPTSLSVEPSENGTIKVSTDSGEKLKVGDTITINPLNAGNPLTSIVTQVENDNSDENKQSLKVSPEFTAIPTSKFSYQQPIMLLADYENNPKIIVNSQGNLGIGTNIPHQKLVINNGGKVGIGYNDINQSAALAIKGNVGIGTQNPDPTAKLEVNGNIKITGDRLKNADNRGIVDTTNQDWLNINPDSDYPGIALYNPVAISSGLAIGELIKISEGELKVNKNAFLAVTSGKVSIGTPQQKRDNTLLEVAGSTIIGSSYINSKTAQENGLLVEGKVNIGGTPEDNQQAKDAQLYTKGDAYIDGEVYATDINITGSRIKSADLLGIIETNAKDWLRVNPDSAYPGIALYNPVAISKGGLAIGKLTQVSDGQLQVSNSAFLATTSGKVSIGTPQEPSGNTLLEVAGSTIIGSSYINSKAAPENGLLVEGRVNIGDKPPEDKQQAEDAQLYTKGDAYIDGKLYTTDLTITGNLEIGESTQLSLSELKVSKNAFLATIKGNQVTIGTELKPNATTILGIAGSTTIGSSSFIKSKTAPENGLLVQGKINIGDKPPENNQQAEEAQLYTKGDAYIDGKLHTTDLTITRNLEIGESTQLSLSELKVSKNAFLGTTKGNQVTIGTELKPNATTILGIAGSTTIGSSSFIKSKPAPKNGLLVEGKVNIGGTAPEDNQQAEEAQLYVNGTFVTNTIVFNESMQRSSQQSKDDITDLTILESLEILEILKPVKYRYNTDETKKIHAGFIAEQSPDLFTSPDKTMLNSTGIIAILTNVLKEHIRTNSTLQDVIAQQQQEIANLQERVKTLERKPTLLLVKDKE